VDYLSVRNFEKFQHYKNRKPPWIKLYRDLWRDPRFFVLNERERYYLISFFVLASQNDNRLPADQTWLRHELATSQPVPLEKFIQAGWLVTSNSASKTLASRKQNAIAETETETDKREKPPFPPSGAFEERWKLFPNPRGRKAAEKHFGASVRTVSDLSNLDEAMRNYVFTVNHENNQRREHGQSLRRWQNGSTWFNQWKDWIPVIGNGNGQARHGPHWCGFCPKPHEWACNGDCDLQRELSCPAYRLQRAKSAEVH
jgi:hypothetical protein